jgi:YD repeat-containing protein
VATTEHRRFDEYGRLTEQVDPAGRLLRHRHDARGRQVESGDARGYRAVRRHDAEGRLVRFGLHPPGSDEPVRASYLRYGADGRLAAILEPDGRTTRVIVDGNGTVLGQLMAKVRTWSRRPVRR